MAAEVVFIAAVMMLGWSYIIYPAHCIHTCINTKDGRQQHAGGYRPGH